MFKDKAAPVNFPEASKPTGSNRHVINVKYMHCMHGRAPAPGMRTRVSISIPCLVIGVEFRCPCTLGTCQVCTLF